VHSTSIIASSAGDRRVIRWWVSVHGVGQDNSQGQTASGSPPHGARSPHGRPIVSRTCRGSIAADGPGGWAPTTALHRSPWGPSLPTWRQPSGQCLRGASWCSWRWRAGRGGGERGSNGNELSTLLCAARSTSPCTSHNHYTPQSSSVRHVRPYRDRHAGWNVSTGTRACTPMHASSSLRHWQLARSARNGRWVVLLQGLHAHGCSHTVHAVWCMQASTPHTHARTHARTHAHTRTRCPWPPRTTPRRTISCSLSRRCASSAGWAACHGCRRRSQRAERRACQCSGSSGSTSRRVRHAQPGR
jgi:hypothetical protein